MSEAGSHPYVEIIHRSLPRLLSLLDRDPFSPTFGCFDRPFWHYKTCTDFPSAILQQGLLPLALLYRNEMQGNPCYGSSWALDAVCAAMRFWAQNQNRDGSFNEWYPGEHSHVATAFTAYAVSETLLILGEEVPGGDRRRVVDVLLKAARWLTKIVDREVLNHSAGALAALHNIHLLCPEQGLSKAVDQYLEVLKQGQNEEGWFREYGGADIGYQGVTLDYLAKYLERSGDEKVVPLIDRGLGFFSRFIYPDGTCGGPMGSRSTRYLLPHGLEILKGRWKQASDVLDVLKKALSGATAIGPEQVDDRYFTFFFFPNLVQACVHAAGHKIIQSTSPVVPEESPPRSLFEYFPQSGLVAAQGESYRLVGNLKKSGVMRIYAGETAVFSDAGYFGELTGGRVVSTNWLNPGTNVEQDPDGLLSLRTQFVRIDYRYPLKRLLIPFRLFNHTVGRSGFLMQLFNRIIKTLLISPSKVEPIELVRSIRILSQGVTVRDKIQTLREVGVTRLLKLNDATTGHIPTSRYWVQNGIASTSVEPDYAKTPGLSSSIELERRIVVKDDEASIEVFCNGRQVMYSVQPVRS